MHEYQPFGVFIFDDYPLSSDQDSSAGLILDDVLDGEPESRRFRARGLPYDRYLLWASLPDGEKICQAMASRDSIYSSPGAPFRVLLAIFVSGAF